MAGSGNRDVTLVISAKNEATKAIDSVADALTALKNIQNGVGESAEKADGLLGDLGQQFQRLANEAKGLEALNTVAGALDKAAGAVGRLQTQVERTGSESGDLAARYTEAGEATAGFAARVEEAKTALAGQQQSLVSLKDAQIALNEQVKASQSAFSEARTALVRAKEPSDALKQAYRDQLGALLALYSEQERGIAGIQAQKNAVEQARASFKDLETQVRTAGEAEDALAAASQRAASTLERQEASLATARDELEAIAQMSAEASAALGGVAVSQGAISEASKRTAVDLERVRAAMAAQGAAAGAAGASAQPGSAAAATQAFREQVVAVRAAQESFETARAEATRLGADIARTAEPTRELQTAFLLAKAAAEQAGREYVSQADALNRLRGVTQGSITTFLQQATVAQQSAQAEQAAAAAARQLAQTLPAITPRAQEATQAFRNLVSALFQIPEAAGAAEAGVSKVGNSSRESLGLLERMRGELIALTTAYVGFYGAIQAVGGVVDTFKTIQSAQQRLAVSFDGDKNAVSGELGFIREQADRLGVSFKGLLDGYTRVSFGAREMGFSTEGARKILVSMSEAAKVAGLSGQDLDGTLRGLFELIDRGTINARNFSIQIGQRIPGANKAMADALGVSVERFRELQRSAGGIAATEPVLTRFAANLSKSVAGELPEAVESLDSNINRFLNLLTDAEERVANGGFAAGLTKALKALDQEFKSGAGDSFFRQVGAALGALAGIVPLVVQNFDLLVTAVKVLVALKVANFFLDQIRAGTLFGVSMTTAAADVDRLSGAIVRLKGFNLAAFFAGIRTSATEAAEGFALASNEARLLAVGEGLAAVASTALGATITTLRGIMIGAAAIARAMWIAIGGFPGLLITGLTFVVTTLLGQWISGVDKANVAMDTHRDIMDKVRQAYADTAGEADKLKDKLKDISTVQVEINSHSVLQDLGGTRAKIGGVGAGLGSPTEDYSSGILEIKQTLTATEKQVQAASKAFAAGSLSADAFKARVNGLAEADPHLDRGVVKQLLDLADKGRDAERTLKENDAILRVIKGSASDADKALLGLGQTAKAATAAFDSGPLDKFNKAILELKKEIPGLAAAAEAELKLLALKDKVDAAKVEINSSNLPADQKAQRLAAIDGLAAQARTQLIGSAAVDQAQAGSGAPNIAVARRFIGLNEGKPKDDRTLADFFRQATGQGVDPKITAWCAAFVNSVLATNGLPQTGSLAARSFANYGTPVANDQAQPGDIVLIKGAGKNAISHVGFFDGYANGGVRVLGGNQGAEGQGRVSEETFKASSVVGFRRAPGLPEQVAQQDRADDTLAAFDKFKDELVKGLERDAAAVAVSPRDAFINSKLEEAQRRADESGPTESDPTRPKLTVTDADRARITAAAGKDFDVKALQEEQKKVAAAQEELDGRLKSSAESLTREEYISNEAKRVGINLLDEQGKKFAEIKGKVYDLNQQQAAYNNVLGLSDQRKTLAGQLQTAFKEGDRDEVSRLQTEIASVTEKLLEGLPAARAYAEALGDQKMVAQLQKVSAGLQQVKVELVDAKQINSDLASGGVQAFDKISEAMGKFVSGTGKLKDVLAAARDAFLSFAADFLKQIAEMILKQTLLNALGQSSAGTGIAGFINGLVGGGGGGGSGASGLFSSLFSGGAASASGDALADSDAVFASAGLLHGGGIAGRPGGQSRPGVLSAIFDNAVRYHGGGVAGLKPNEVPTILERGEEVLRANDPRHVLNGGGGGGGAAPTDGGTKVVVALDGSDVLNHALQSEVGQKVLLKHFKANAGAIKTAIGAK